MNLLGKAVAVGCALFSGVVAVPVAAQSLDLTGYWPGAGNTGSRVFGLSADGSVAVGFSLGGGVPPIINPGFTWTRAGGRVDFGLQPGMPAGTLAFGVSGNGQVVVGEGVSTAFRWTGSGAVENLGVQPGYTSARALGTDNTGGIVVGRSEAGQTGEFGQAFRWTSTTGMVGLGYTRPEHFYSEAAAISRDGSTIVGHGRGGSGWNEAFVWRAGVMTALPGLAESNDGRAFGVNHNGSIIVGDSSPGPFQSAATMWIGGQPISLGLAQGFSTSMALAVNDAGSVVVGHVNGATGIGQTAAIWTPQRGMEPLSNYLAFHGITVPSNVNLLSATSVSADGMTIGGRTGFPGLAREGFVVTIPAPSVFGVVALGFGAAVFLRRRRRFIRSQLRFLAEVQHGA